MRGSRPEPGRRGRVRSATTSWSQGVSSHELIERPGAPPLGYPPVDLDADYVIGPYAAAFAEMNAQGSTTERLISWRLKD
jgi:hypothetical protein